MHLLLVGEDLVIKLDYSVSTTIKINLIFTKTISLIFQQAMEI